MSATADLTAARSAWDAALAAAGAAERPDHAFAVVVAAYAEPHRHYHTLAHVSAVAAAVRRCRPTLSDPPSVELAAWLHDIIYEPRSSANEERSADRATDLLDRLGVSAGRLETVRRLILTTRHGYGTEVWPDAAVLLDCDLAILGADEPDYVRYARAIRKEYSWVPERHYRDGRTKVLRGFLQRDRIFHTASYVAELETTARRNLAWEIETLT